MSERVESVPGYFQDMAYSLHHLRNHESFTDLTFLCTDGPVHCHKAMLLPHSSLLKDLFIISASKQASDNTVISLPQVEKLTVIKMLQYVYQGQAKFVKDQDIAKVFELADVVLGIDMSFADSGEDNELNDGNYNQEAAEQREEVLVEDQESDADDKEDQENDADDKAPVNVSRKRNSQAVDTKTSKKRKVVFPDDSDDSDDGSLAFVLTKQRAAENKMKLKLRNYGHEKHIKELIMEMIHEKNIEQQIDEEDNSAEESGFEHERREESEHGDDVDQSFEENMGNCDDIDQSLEENMENGDDIDQSLEENMENGGDTLKDLVVNIKNEIETLNSDLAVEKRKQKATTVKMKLEIKNDGIEEIKDLEEVRALLGDKQTNSKQTIEVGSPNVDIDDSDQENIYQGIANDENVGSSSTSSGFVWRPVAPTCKSNTIKLDKSLKTIDDKEQKLQQENLDNESEGLDLPSSMMEKSKQKAALDNMKVQIKNYATEENIKEKIKDLVKDIRKPSDQSMDTQDQHYSLNTTAMTILENSSVGSTHTTQPTTTPIKDRTGEPRYQSTPAKTDQQHFYEYESDNEMKKQNENESDKEIKKQNENLGAQKMGDNSEEISGSTKKTTSFFMENVSNFQNGDEGNSKEQQIQEEVANENEMRNELEKEWKTKAKMDKMKVKMPAFDKDPLYSEIEIKEMIQQALLPLKRDRSNLAGTSFDDKNLNRRGNSGNKDSKQEKDSKNEEATKAEGLNPKKVTPVIIENVIQASYLINFANMNNLTVSKNERNKGEHEIITLDDDEDKVETLESSWEKIRETAWDDHLNTSIPANPRDYGYDYDYGV